VEQRDQCTRQRRWRRSGGGEAVVSQPCKRISPCEYAVEGGPRALESASFSNL
jgi:hypothetical protein